MHTVKMEGFEPPKRNFFKQPFSRQSDWNMAEAAFNKAQEDQWKIGIVLPIAKQSIYTPNGSYSLQFLFDCVQEYYRDFSALASDDIRVEFEKDFAEIEPLVRKKVRYYARNDRNGCQDKNRPAFALIDRLDRLYADTLLLRQKLGAGLPTRVANSEFEGMRGLLRGKSKQ